MRKLCCIQDPACTMPSCDDRLQPTCLFEDVTMSSEDFSCTPVSSDTCSFTSSDSNPTSPNTLKRFFEPSSQWIHNDLDSGVDLTEPQTPLPLHTVLHYSADAPLTRLDYAPEDCPTCSIPDVKDEPVHPPKNAPPAASFQFYLVPHADPLATNFVLDITGSDVTITVDRFPPIRQRRLRKRFTRKLPPRLEPSRQLVKEEIHLGWQQQQQQQQQRQQLQVYYRIYRPVFPTLVSGIPVWLAPLDPRWYTGVPVLTVPLPPLQQETHVLPEPIVVSRSEDCFDSLKTCLIPPTEFTSYQVSQPPNRVWRQLREPDPSGMHFTVMCYNVLCSKYATSSMYPYAPSWALTWDYRRRGVLEEIRMYNADIVCLQELETVQYEEVFKLEMEKQNYDSIFLPKSRHRTMGESDSKAVDGCAIFWRNTRFEKVFDFKHEFMFSCTNVSENPNPHLLNRVMTRDNVSIGVIFKTRDSNFPSRHLCVTTGHIHWDPEFSDVKLVQTIMWTAEMWRYIDTFLRSQGSPSCMEPSSMPVIMLGDLNSLPASGVVDFLMKGSLDMSHADFRQFGSKYGFDEWTTLEKWALDGDKLSHRFYFDRAYKEGEGMRWTNYTYDFKGMIDYVFFTQSHFRLLGSLDMIDEAWFEEEKVVGCPHVHCPSDHFSLLVELELKPGQEQTGGSATDDN